ncbi:hypothetical protein Tco_0057790 [Tanacetum coccineum]
MANLSEDIQCAGSDTRPPMLDRTDFASWQQRIRLYCRGKENGVNILKSIDEGPFQMGTTRDTLAKGTESAQQLGLERARVYSNLSPEDKDRYNADIRATNILLQGLPKDIYTLINHYTDAKDIWDNVKMLLEGSELTKEDRESQLYDDFEHFRQNKGETIHDYYVRFAKLINDMRNIKMTMSRMQLNSKFVNNMLPEWGRFVTTVKLNSGLRDSNYDQLYAYLKQHEAHANENKMMLDRFTQHTVDPLALMSNVSHQQYYSQSSTTPPSTYVPPHFADNTPLDSGLSPTDNLIENLTNTLALLTQSYKTYLPQTNNQLRTSSNTRNQATVQDGKKTKFFLSNELGKETLPKFLPISELSNTSDAVRKEALPKFLLISELSNTLLSELISRVTGLLKDFLQRVKADELQVFEDLYTSELGKETLPIVFLASELSSLYLASYKDDRIKSGEQCTGLQVHRIMEPHSKELHSAQATTELRILQRQDVVDIIVILLTLSDEAPTSHNYDHLRQIYHPHIFTINANLLQYDSDILSENNVVDNSLTAELATYKEQVELYERWAKFELTEREQKIDEQLKIVITDRNHKEESLKRELHFVKLQLTSTINHNKSMIEEVTSLKKDFKQKENKYLEEFLDMKALKEKWKNLLIANDNLIPDSLSKEVFYIATNSELTVSRFTEMHEAYTIVQTRCLELKAELSKLRDKVQKDDHTELVKRFSNLEVNHLNLQLKYQNLKDSFENNASPPARDTLDFDSVFVIEKMKASIQGNNNAIKKLRMQISQLKETRSEADRTLDFRALDFQIIQLTEKVTTLQEQNELFRAENSKVKQHYKELYDPIKITLAKHIEQTTALTTENENLKAYIHENLQCNTIDSVKPRVLTPDSVKTLREIVEEAKVERSLDRSLASACLYTKHSQELLEYAIGTCPKDFNQKDKKHAYTPLNKKKQVTFEDQCVTSNNKTHKHLEQRNIQKTNVHVLPPTGVNSYTNVSGSQPRSNTKKNRISPAKSVNKKKVEEHTRTNKSSLKTTNHVDSSISSKRTVINSNSHSVFQTCNKCLISANHDMCVVDYLHSMNASPSIHNVVRKVRQVWKPKQVRQVWKATGKVLTNVGHQWRPTGRYSL